MFEVGGRKDEALDPHHSFHVSCLFWELANVKAVGASVGVYLIVSERVSTRPHAHLRRALYANVPEFHRVRRSEFTESMSNL